MFHRCNNKSITQPS